MVIVEHCKLESIHRQNSCWQKYVERWVYLIMIISVAEMATFFDRLRIIS